MPKTRLQKEQTVEQLKDKLSRAKSVVFTDYKGLTMHQLSNLRDKLRDQQAEFAITKNTLLQRAIQTTNYQLLTTNYEGPTATLFAFDDEISPIKILVKALKDAALGKVKAGILGQEVLDEAGVERLANLPTKDELRGQAVAVLAAPLQGMVGVLSGNLRNLVYALNQIKIAKGGV